MNRLVIRFSLLVAVFCIVATVQAEEPLDTLLQRGADLLVEGADSAAKVEFIKALKLDPDNFVAVKNLGLIHSRAGNHDQARVFLERAFNMNPLDAAVCNNLGTVYSHLGNSGEAIRYFENAVAIDSTNALYLTNLGQEYTKLGRIGQALPRLRSAWGFDQRSAIIPYSLGNCFAATDSYDSAEYYYRLSADMGGRPAELHYRLGAVQNRLGKTVEAIESYQEALTRQPDHRGCRQALALLFLADKQYDAAAEQFGVLVGSDSAFFPAWIGLGTAHALAGRSEQSDQVLQHLYAVDSTWGFRMLEFLRQQQTDSDTPDR